MDNMWIQLIQSYMENPVFSWIMSLLGFIGTIFTIVIPIIPWIKTRALGKNRRAYKGVILRGIYDFKFSDWVKREIIFITEFLTLLLNTYLVLGEIYLVLFFKEIRENDLENKVYMALFSMGAILAILIICGINATRRITQNIKNIMFILSVSIAVLMLYIFAIPLNILNEHILYVLFIVSIVAISLVDYYIHKLLKIEESNRIIISIVVARHLVFDLYLMYFLIFRNSNSYVIYIWLVLCVIENFFRWREEDMNRLYCVYIYTNYGEECVKNSIIRYGNDKIAFKTDSSGTKIINADDIKFIKYQKKRVINSKIRKKPNVYCQFKSGICIQYDYYRFIDNQWIEFYSDTDKIRTVEIYKSEDIVKIQEN